MAILLPISDDLAARLGGATEVSRRALEAFGLAEYRAGRLSASELRTLLDFRFQPGLDAPPGSSGEAGEQESAVPAALRDHPASLLGRMRAFRIGKTLGGVDPMLLIREGRR